MRVKSLLFVLGAINAASAIANSVTLDLQPSTLNNANCQDNQCTWQNNSSSNLVGLESDNAFCSGTNKALGGTSSGLGLGAYNMILPKGIAKAKIGKDSDVILELFNTPYKLITHKMLKQYAEMGYATIWISPPQKNAYVPYWKKNIPAWYGAYQPLDFGQIGNDKNVMSFGSAEDLANLINQAHHEGLKVIVDLAIHQFAQPGVNDTKFYQEYFGEKYIFESGNMAAINKFWWPQTKVKGYIPLDSGQKCSVDVESGRYIALVGNNPNGKIFSNQESDTKPWTDDFSALNGWFDGVLPAPTNSSIGVEQISCRTKEVFNGFAAWLLGADYKSGSIKSPSNPERGFNIDGFRIDDISGQSVDFYNQLFQATAKYNKASNLFFGEYPTESATDYDKYIAIKTADANISSNHQMKMLNFPLLVTLKKALSESGNLQTILQQTINSQYAYIGTGKLAGGNAINLVIDQDTAPDSISSRAMCPWDGVPQQPDYVMNYSKAPLAYGIILAMSSGTPYVFADLQAANKVGISESGAWAPELANGSVSYWNQNEVIAGIYFHNQVLGQSMEWGKVNNAKSNTVATFTRGNEYLFIINNSTIDYQAIASNANLRNGSYIDLMSRQIIKVANGKIDKVVIPAKSVMYFVPYLQ